MKPRSNILKSVLTKIRNKRSLIGFSFLFFLLFNVETVVAASPLDIQANTPAFIQIFLIINIVQLFIATVMTLEVKKISVSKVWNRILSGNFACMLLTVSVAVLLNGWYPLSSITKLIGIAFFFTFAVSMVILAIYYLIKPLIKRKIEVFKPKHAGIYVIALFTSYLLIKILPYIEYPSFPNIRLLYALAFLYILMMLYFGYVSLYISKGYEKIGFVHTAFIMPPIGTVAIALMGFLIINVTKNTFNAAYYYISGIFICSAFTFIYYLLFIVEYPSILNPKWKALMPFDIIKASTSTTIVFLAASLYFTVKENQSFTFYQIISNTPIPIFLLIILLLTAFLLEHNNAITERVKSKHENEETHAITNLLNVTASQFLKSDYLQDVWEKNIDKYVAPKDQEKIGFEPSKRRFDINGLDNLTKNMLATGMLIDMQNLATKKQDAVMATDSFRTVKKDIEDILQEEIFILPDELRTGFDEEEFYPLLFEKLVNESAERIKAFVPTIEHRTIFDKLSRISNVFADSTYNGTKIGIPKETKFTREQFIEHFKSYLSSLEDLFPFEEILLYEPLKREIKEEILQYGFSVEDLLDQVPTGVDNLDEITEGGLPKKSSTLILCKETIVKKNFLMSFVKQGIRDRDRIIYATSKQSSEDILKELQKDFPVIEKLTIVDLYQDIHTSNRVSEVIEKKNTLTVPTNTLLFLRQSVVKTIRKYPKNSHKRLILDVYNDLLKLFPYAKLSTLLFQQLDGLRKWNCTTLLTLDPDLINAKRLKEMEKKFENVLVINDDKGGKKSILIKKLHGGTPKQKVVSLR